MNILALTLYTSTMIVACVTATIYYLSNRTLPNYMIKATFWLLIGVSINALATWVLRMFMTLNIVTFHAFADYIVLTARIVLFTSLLNFLKQSVRIGKKK